MLDSNLTDDSANSRVPGTTRPRRWLKPALRLRLPLQISERRLLMMTGDLAAILCSIGVALRLWAATANEPFDLQFVAWRSIWFVVLPASWLVLASANDYFSLLITSRIRTSLGRLARILLQLLLLYLLFFFSVPDKLPRLFILNYILFSFVFIGAWRTWQPFLLGWTGFRRRAVILGVGHSAALIAETILKEAAHDYEIVGFVCSISDLGAEPHALGTGTDLPGIVEREGVVEIINAYVEQLPADVFEGVMACYEQGIMLVSMPLLYEEITGRVPIEHIGQQYWVLPSGGNTGALRAYPAIKRVMDITCSAIGLLVFVVLLPVLAILIKLDSPGPLYYRQERVGRKGRTFLLLKLRSMVADAERDSGPQWSQVDDARITRVGRVLRKLRLDELPQLLNVLRGDMSLIGPRPERPMFVEQLMAQIPFYRTRLTAKPGITGWAQAHYPYGSSTEDALQKLQYDLYYIRHQSLALDLQIMVRTVGKILLAQGR